MNLRQGSEGEDVEQLQRDLKSLGWDLEVDGVFGQDTLNAVREFQSDHGLSADGVCGQNTWGAIADAVEAKQNGGSAAVASISSDDDADE